MNIVRKHIEFCAAHRLPTHAGKCRNLHGHQYRVETELVADFLDEDGMVLDFSLVKEVMQTRIHHRVDHATIVHIEDEPLLDYLRTTGSKYLATPFYPTAENLAQWAYGEVCDGLEAALGFTEVRVNAVTVWETPTSSCRFENPPVETSFGVKVAEALEAHHRAGGLR